MRPVEIQLHGLTSFREPQTIRFDDLELFVITGPTGAGKTSLLDAMILALYGRVPRAGTKQVRELVSHGMAEARVKFEFDLGNQRYRIARRVPRNSSQSATLESLAGDTWLNEVDGGGVRAVDKRIVELLKLNYDAFTRAVVLPQGKFAEFLAGDSGQRRELMTELLGLKHYIEMGKLARGRANDLETKIETRQKVLDENYADVSPEALAELQSTAKTAADEAKALTASVKQAVHLEKGRAEVEKCEGAVLQALDELEALAPELSGVVEAAAETEKREAGLAEEAQECEKEVASRKKAVKDAAAKLKKTTDQHGGLEQLALVGSALQSADRCASRLAEQEQQQTKLGEQVGELRKALEGQRDAAKSAAETLGQATERAGQAREERQKQEKEASDLARSLERLDERLGQLAEAEGEHEKAAARLAKAAAAVEPAAKRLEQADEAVARLQHQHAAAVLARDVKTGDPCPVCRRPLGEHPAVDADVSDKIEEAQAKATQARQRHGDAVAEQRAAEEALRRCDRGVETENKAVAALLGKDEARDQLAERVDTAVAAAESAAAALAEAEDSLEAERTTLASLEGEVKESTARLDGAEERRASIKARLDELTREQAEAAKLLAKHFGARVPKDAEERLAKQRTAVVEAQEALETARAKLDLAVTAEDELDGRLGAVRSELATIDSQLAAARASAAGARSDLCRQAAGVETIDEPDPLPAEDESRSRRAKELADWRDAAGRAARKAQSATTKLLAKSDKELLAVAKKAKVEAPSGADVCEALREAEADVRDEHTRRKTEAQQMKDRLKQRDQLSSEISDDADKAVVLKDLAAELRAGRFVDFIQQRTLDVLAGHASQQLRRISDERYSLGSEESHFYVIDHSNADERRGVETLSGGETFLASLSLALALSQYVGDLATEGLGAKLEAVFIDEGFGALDDDALDEVIEALERLRESELMVGVITHVRALAQRIRDGVRVSSDKGMATVELVAVE